MRTIHVLFAGMGLAAGLAAQFPSSGFFIEAPVAVRVENAANRLGTPYGERSLLTKKAGLREPTPFASAVPNFDFAAILGVTDVSVAAMSLGLETIAADDTGKVVFPSGGWSALLFTVHPTSDPGGSGAFGTVLREYRTGGAAADVFSYVLNGSMNLPMRHIGTTMRAIDSLEMDLRPNGPATEPDLRALDTHMTFYELGPEMRQPRLPTGLPANPTIYFTIERADASGSPNSWWTSVGGRKSAASILCSTWSTTRPVGWTMPTVFIDYGALGLDVTDAIDGLAVSTATDGKLLYSTDDVTDPQLWFALWRGRGKPITTALNPVVYHYPPGPGGGVGGGTGGGGGVGDFCVVDPGQGGGGTIESLVYGAPLMSQWFGQPGAGQLGASALRGCDAAGNPTLETFLSGPGGGPSGPFAVAVQLEIGGATSPWYPLALTPHLLTGAPGRPLGSAVTLIPPYLLPTSGFATFVWGAGDPTGVFVSDQVRIPF